MFQTTLQEPGDRRIILLEKVAQALGASPQPDDADIDLLKRIAVAKGATPQPGDSEIELLKKITVAFGGSPQPGDSALTLFKKIAVAAGGSPQPGDSVIMLLGNIAKSVTSGGGVSPPPTGPFDPVANARSLYTEGSRVLTGSDVNIWNDVKGVNNLTLAGPFPPQDGGNLNGHRWVYFDSSNQILRQATPHPAFASNGSQGATLIAVLMKVAAQNGGLYAQGEILGPQYHPANNASIVDGFCSTTAKACGTNVLPMLSSWRILSIRSRDNDYKMQINGTPQFSTTTNTFTNGNRFTLGCGKDDGVTPDYFYQAGITEIALFNKYLTDQELADSVAYYRDKFAITEFNPSVSADVLYDSTGLVFSGTNCSGWNDSKSGAKNMTVGASPPQTGGLTLNGYRTAQFSGGQYFTRATAFVPGTEATIIMVVMRTSALATNDGMYQQGAGFSNHLPFNDGTIYDGFCATARQTCGAQVLAVPGNWRVITIRSKNGDYRFDIDGTRQFTTATNTFSAYTSIVIGAGGIAAYFLTGYMAEIAGFSRFLTDQEIAEAVAFYKTKFAL